MANYLIRRSFQMIFVVLFATVAIYLLLNAVPGGPLSGLNLATDAKQRLSEQDIARLEATLGLNKPVYLAYLTWLLGEDWVNEVGAAIGNPGPADKMFETGTWSDFQSPTCQNAGGTNQGHEGIITPCNRGVLRWDWGESWSLARGQAVSSVIGSRVTNTVILMSSVTVISLLVAIPIGILSAVKQYSKLDYAVTTFSFFGIAMPVFWFGLLLIIGFGLKFPEWFGWPAFPTGDVFTTRVIPGSLQDVLNVQPRSLGDRIVHLILPVSVLTLLYLAGWSRFMRSSMLEVLRQDYVRTARAKGLRERVVVLKHAARNALIPLITIVVFQIPGIFGGATLTETIFNYPGIGRLFVEALNRDDWPIVMAILFISAILVVIATLVGDILYTVVDPRIRFD